MPAEKESEENKMIKYAGMKAEQSGNNNRNLPAGAYVCQVLDARIEGDEPDQRLAVLFEIYEGPYKGFYMNKYKAQKERGSNYDIKYKGIIRLRIPNPDNKMAQYPESDARKFNDMIARFQNSNEGLELINDDGCLDETKMKGRLIGVTVVDSEYNGAAFTKPVRFENVDDVRNGTVKPMRQRDDQQDPTNAPMVDQRSGMQVVNTESLPWD